MFFYFYLYTLLQPPLFDNWLDILQTYTKEKNPVNLKPPLFWVYFEK